MTNGLEESKGAAAAQPRTSDNMFAELQKVRRELFENEFSQEADDEDIMDFNIGDDDIDLGAAVSRSPSQATLPAVITTPPATR